MIVEVLKKCGDDLSREESHPSGNQHSRAATADVSARCDDQRLSIERGLDGEKPGWRASTVRDGCCWMRSAATDGPRLLRVMAADDSDSWPLLQWELDSLGRSMSNILICGGGPIGLCAAAMLGRDGHRVTVLEADPDGQPGTSIEGWKLVGPPWRGSIPAAA